MSAKSAEPIFFYLPHRADGIAVVPDSMQAYWPWLLEQSGKNKGKYSWTLQTYLQLRDAGFPCALSESFPKRGIVIAHRDFLPIFLRPRAGVFLICIKPDRKEHTWAQYYVVQNSRDDIFQTRKGAGRTSAVPFWPQPSLVPRDASRGTTCTNVAYLGRALNLAPELTGPAWSGEVATLGMSWSSRDIARWNDYSDVDVTVSIRTFGAGKISHPVFNPDSKPPSKLINSWLAGVPAILGAESAYQSIRQDPLDYIEVTSPAELTAALLKLRDDPALYRAMVEHGWKRAEGFSVAAVGRRWMEVLEKDIAACHADWRGSGTLGRLSKSVRNISEYFASGQNLRDLLTIFK